MSYSQDLKKHYDSNNAYLPILDNTSWTKIYHNVGDLRAWSSVYKYTGDTLIGDRLYKIIIERMFYVEEPTLDPNEGIYLCYEDTENKRVYLYSRDYKRDILLYDFSVQVGDNMPCDRIRSSYYSDFILTDISPIENSGYTRLQYTFVNGSDTIIWLEGIGNINDFIRPVHRHIANRRMLCVQKNEETVYETESFLGKTCEDVTTIYTSLITHESIEHIPDTTPSTAKIFRDGQIYILRGDHTYTLTGQEVK